LFAQRFFQQGLVDGRHRARHANQVLVRVQQPPRVAIGIGDEAVARRIAHRRRSQQRGRARQQLAQVVFTERLEHMHRGA